MKSTKILAITVIAGLFTAACGRNQRSPEATAEAKAGASTSAPPVDVTTAVAISRGLQRGVEVVGSMVADEEVVISAQAPGELSQLNVDFGSFVARGQVIAQLDSRDAKLKGEQGEATPKQTTARLRMKEGGRLY